MFHTPKKPNWFVLTFIILLHLAGLVLTAWMPQAVQAEVELILIITLYTLLGYWVYYYRAYFDQPTDEEKKKQALKPLFIKSSHPKK